MKFNYTHESKCRVCLGGGLHSVLDLGNQPLANSYTDSKYNTTELFPLQLVFCTNCDLIQINCTVNRFLLFRNYLWVTGTSSSARSFSEKFCNLASQKAKLQTGSFVVEIATNDGTFLQPFSTKGCQTLGIDPAKNISKISKKKNLEIWEDFWDEETANKLISVKGKADFIFGRNVVAHVSDLHGFIKGFALALKDGGTGAVEFHWSAQILNGLQYDSIYHEHLCYFGLSSFEYLINLYGLFVYSVHESPISGGAIVVYFKKEKKQDINNKEIEILKDKEEKLGINKLSTWIEFGVRCENHKEYVRSLMEKNKDKKIIGYGSSARSNTFINYIKFDTRSILSIIDNNPYKQGKFTPSSKIPIITEEKGFSEQPDAIFNLAWNFKNEIKEACLRSGFKGDFITAFPNKPSIEKII